jgi:Tol biopolymer transport system component
LAFSSAQGAEQIAIRRASNWNQSELFVSDGKIERPLVAPSGLDYNPSFSSDGQWIVFTSDRSGSADIYRVHPDGSGLERLTDDPAFDDQGTLSPNGRQLAFVSTRKGGHANIWVLDLVAHAVHNATASHVAGNFRPSWSPDGRWIAFSSDRDTHAGRIEHQWELLQDAAIYLIHPDGTDLRRLTPLDRAAGSPKWSNDGQSLVFYEAERPYGKAQIMRLDIATGAAHVITDGDDSKLSPQVVMDGTAYLSIKSYNQNQMVWPSGARSGAGPIQNPSWSPDGRNVVYQRTSLTDKPFLERLPSPNDQIQLVVNTHDPFAALSASGDRIAYAEGHRLMVANADGTGSRVIYSSPEIGQYSPVTWSPDGKFIAFGMGNAFHKDGVSQQVAVIASDGSNFRVVTTGEGSSNFPSFSPDGSKIVYRVFGTQQGLRIQSLNDGTVTKLTDGWDNFPYWSPKGDFIAFTRLNKGNFDIFTIRADGSNIKQLTDDHGNDAHSSWSRDGKRLAFVSSRLGWRDEAILPGHGGQSYGELYTMRSDGTDVQRLTDDQWEDGPGLWLGPPTYTSASKATR